MPNNQVTQVTVEFSDLYEMATLVYSRWSTEFDALKRVRAERDDGSPDWETFHATRLRNHTAAEAKWKALSDRIVKIINSHSR